MFFRKDSRILSDNLKLTFQNLRPISRSSPQGFEKENRNYERTPENFSWLQRPSNFGFLRTSLTEEHLDTELNKF